MDITKLKTLEIRNKIEKKEISCKEVVEAYFKKIEEKDERLNTFISLDKDNALKDAEKIDEKIKNKEKLGLLAGNIVSLKDNIVTKGFKTTAGSKFLEDFISPYDATVVRLIKEEDGIIIGKNNMDEFGIGNREDDAQLGGVKAVAGGEVQVALGSDTDGLLRRNATEFGLVGFKPTYGRISRHGLVALSDSMDQIGIIAKDIEDAIQMFKVISKQDEFDPSTKNIALDLEGLKDTIKGVKIGIVKELSSEILDGKSKDEFENSIKILKECGAIIEDISLANIKYAKGAHRIIMSSEISTNLARFDGIRYGYRAKDYTTLDELYMNSRTDGLGDEVKKQILLGTYLLSNGEVDYYKKALKIRNLLIQDFDDSFNKIDIIMSPVTKISTILANITGLCAVSMASSKKENFMGIQFIGNRFKERDILNVGLVYERMAR